LDAGGALWPVAAKIAFDGDLFLGMALGNIPGTGPLAKHTPYTELLVDEDSSCAGVTTHGTESASLDAGGILTLKAKAG